MSARETDKVSLLHGGFPEVLARPRAARLWFSSYLQTYLERDVRFLEATGQVLVVPPYFENLGKRLIKSPKVYIADSGLACYLLGVETAAELEKSPFLGALFEGLIAAELAKAQVNAGRRRELYYFRDQQGLEVDFVLPSRRGGVLLIEAKATRTPTPAMAAPLQRLAAAWSGKHKRAPRPQSVLIYRPPRAGVETRALAPGVRALAWREFVAELAALG
jgi:predicted AAA+ superfamily ATPase